MEHLSEVLNIMKGAWTGDTNLVASYAELLASKLDDDGEHKQATYVRNSVEVLQGKRKPILIYPQKNDI